MRRLMLFVLGVLLAVPSLANAWTITAKIAAASGSITGGSPTTTVSSGIGTLTVPAGDTTVTVTPSAGYAVSSVLLDNNVLTTPATGGVVSVPQAGLNSRTLTVYFKVATYSMTVNQATNGVINLRQTYPTTGNYTQTGLSNLKMGSKVNITASPNSGCVVTKITVGTTPVWTGTSTAPVIYSYTVGSSSVTVTANFIVTPTATARLMVGSTTAEINSPVTLDASSSSTNDPALTYQYLLTSGDPSKVTITPSGPTSSPTATFQASAASSYSVKLTVTSAHGATSSTTETTITTSTVGDWNSGVCASCHTNRDPVISSQYKQSVHSISGGIGCPQCHNPDGSVPHPHIERPIDSCQPCHATATPTVVSDYVAGPHNNATSICTACHKDHSEKADVTICQSCHNVAFSTNGNHAQFANQPNICVSCHNMHNPHSGASAAHFNGYTSYANPGYAAAYVTPRTACSNCHYTTTLTSPTFASNDGDLKTIREQWADSGHGDVSSPYWKNTPAYDWKTLGSSGVDLSVSASAVDCVRCHTAKGFLKFQSYSIGKFTPVGVASDKASEPLACNACHYPAFVAKTLRGGRVTKVLSIRQVTAYYNYSTAGFKQQDHFLYNEEGDSNICIACHTGKLTGYSIILSQDPVENPNRTLDVTDAAFFDSHGMAAAPVLFNIAAYTFPGREYSESAQHMDGVTQGPCIMCHMDSGVITTAWDNNHSFKPLTRDAAGTTIIAVANPLCNQCHSATASFPLSLTSINDRSAGFQASLKILAAKLADKGLYYNPNVAPYFFKTPNDTSKGNAVRNWIDANTLGAAFNLNLLTKEKGAYTHSPKMTKQWLYDSIDWMDDGALNNSVKATVQAMSGNPDYQAADPYLFTSTGTRW